MFLAVLTPKAKKGAKNNLDTASWQWRNNIIGIDYHYIEDIIEGMTDSGLQEYIDFNLL